MNKILVIWQEIPESIQFYLMPENHEMIKHFEKCNNYFINQIYDNLDENELDDISSSLNILSDYYYQIDNNERTFINPDIMQYHVDNRKVINEVISKILITGMFL